MRKRTTSPRRTLIFWPPGLESDKKDAWKVIRSDGLPSLSRVSPREIDWENSTIPADTKRKVRTRFMALHPEGLRSRFGDNEKSGTCPARFFETRLNDGYFFIAGRTGASTPSRSRLLTALVFISTTRMRWL